MDNNFPLDLPIYENVPLCPVCKAPLKADGETENCASCKSRPRIRALVPALEKVASILSPKRKQSLIFSPSKQEWNMLGTLCPQRLSVTLYGKYAGDCQEGIDARDLARFADNSFSLHYSCLLFDYFEEHGAALAEAWRVLEPGGVFMTHIAPGRLINPPSQAPKIKVYITDPTTAYLAYVPEGDTVPLVLVGSDWFVQTMEKTGFETIRLKYRDSLSKDEQIWFIGIKPRSNYKGYRSDNRNTKNSAKYCTVPATMESLTHFRLILGNKIVTINFEHILLDSVSKNPPYMRLLDCRHGLLAAESYPAVYLSKDNGTTWSKIYENQEYGYLARIFILRDGSMFLIYQENSKGFIHIDSQGKVLRCYEELKYCWHGSQGIGESEQGIVMFAEYPGRKQLEQSAQQSMPLSIWRWRPGEEHWERVFSASSYISPEMRNQCSIRHFHVCAPTGRQPGEWVASSGDLPTHAKFWLTEDDGEHWQEYSVGDPDFGQMDVDSKYFSMLFRFTSFSTTSCGEFLWGTDDVIPNLHKSVLVLATKNKNSLRCNVLSELGFNPIRNIIKLETDIFLAISESSRHKAVVEFHLVDTSQHCITSFSLPNTRNARSPVTGSIGSREGKDGLIFLPSTKSLLTNKSGLFRMRYTITSSD